MIAMVRKVHLGECVACGQPMTENHHCPENFERRMERRERRAWAREYNGEQEHNRTFSDRLAEAAEMMGIEEEE